MQRTRTAWLAALIQTGAIACSSPTAPLAPGYDGDWAGTTNHGTSVSFNVTNEQVRSFTLTFALSPTCAGTETIPGPQPITTQDPPGPPPFDQPGFAMGRAADDFAWGIAAYGAFSPDRRSVSGEFLLVQYPGCGTVQFEWSARRR